MEYRRQKYGSLLGKFQKYSIETDEFEKIAGFPDVYAAVDGSHVLRNRHDKETGADIIETCVCLHNFCSENENMNDSNDWLVHDILLRSKVCDPSTEHALNLGEQKREHLKDYLFSLTSRKK